MKVILTEDVKGQGQKDDLITVASGYARNFLLPKGLATPATAEAIVKAKQIQSERAEKREQISKDAAKYAKKLADATLSFKHKVSSGDKLFAGITEAEVATAIVEQLKIEIDKSQISFADGHPKTLGEHTAQIHVFGEHHAEIKLVVEEEK